MAAHINTVRPLKAKKIDEYRDHYVVNNERPGLVETNDAVILPLRRGKDSEYEYGFGGVLRPDGNLADYSSSADRIGRGYIPLYEPVAENKRVAYCGYFNPQWGHFLFESLSRLWITADKECCGQIDEYIFVTDENGQCELKADSNHAELFRILGIHDRIRIISRPTKFSSVVVPEETFILGKMLNMAFSRLLDKIRINAMDHSEPHYKKILLGRSSFKKAIKYELGISLIEDHFRENGYEIVYPERIHLSRLINMIGSAEETVTFSGSVAHNMLFAPFGSQVCVLERFPYVNYYQTAADILRGLDTTYVDANAFIRPVDVGLGPFIYCCNEYFNNYCNLRGLSKMPPVSDKERRRMLRKFLRLQNREYGSRWEMPEWLAEHRPLMEEALADSRHFYDESTINNRLFHLSEKYSPYKIARNIYRIFK